MNRKDALSLIGALCVGFFGGSLVFPGPTPIAVQAPTPATAPVVVNAAHMTGDSSELELKALQKELEAQRRKSATLVASLQSLSRMPQERTPDERRQRFQASLETARSAERQRDNDKLLAAGFTAERIGWLRHRGEERHSMALQATYDRQHKGLAIHPEMYLFDEDLDLWKDIGEAEYDRYRQALGKPLSVAVKAVQAGSVAERAGVRQDDEVIRYDGNRIYNIDQLKALASETRRDAMVALELRRDGQLVQLSLPGGPAGVEADSMSQMKEKRIAASLPESIRGLLPEIQLRAPESANSPR